MNNIFSRCRPRRMCQGCGILSKILIPYLSWLTCAITGGSPPWYTGPWARRWLMPPWAWMGGSSRDTASPEAPPITWGATSTATKKSTRYRTVNRLSTVTRKGLVPMASAMVVKLWVDLIHHPLSANAPTPSPAQRGIGGYTAGAGTFSPGLGEGGGKSMPSLPLGCTSHQIRG